MVKILNIYYLHSELQSLSQPQAFLRLLMYTYNCKVAFWFAPMVTQIISVTKFDMFHLSTTVYALIQKIWTDYYNNYKNFEF